MDTNPPVVQVFRPNPDGDTWRYTTEPRWVHAQRFICAAWAQYRNEVRLGKPWAVNTLREIRDVANLLRARREWL